MPSSNMANGRQYWSTGRGFTSSDPERQVEVIGYVRTAVGTGPARPAAAKPVRNNWARIQPDVESSSFEGSSSRRWR